MQLDFDEFVQFHNSAITLRADDAGGEYRRGQFDRHAEVPETKAQSIDF